MRKLILAVALTAAVPALATTTTVYAKYESVRQALLRGSLDEVRTGARTLAAAARDAKQEEIAKRAEAVARSADLRKARAIFSSLSEEMIRVRAGSKGERPAVYYCSMLRKSWLQPKGTVGNPYDPSMPTCGELKEE